MRAQREREARWEMLDKDVGLESVKYLTVIQFG